MSRTEKNQEIHPPGHKQTCQHKAFGRYAIPQVSAEELPQPIGDGAPRHCGGQHALGHPRLLHHLRQDCSEIKSRHIAHHVSYGKQKCHSLYAFFVCQLTQNPFPPVISSLPAHFPAGTLIYLAPSVPPLLAVWAAPNNFRRPSASAPHHFKPGLYVCLQNLIRQSRIRYISVRGAHFTDLQRCADPHLGTVRQDIHLIRYL